MVNVLLCDNFIIILVGLSCYLVIISYKDSIVAIVHIQNNIILILRDFLYEETTLKLLAKSCFYVIRSPIFC